MYLCFVPKGYQRILASATCVLFVILLMDQELISIILNVLAPVIVPKLIVIKNRSVRPCGGGIKPARVV